MENDLEKFDKMKTKVLKYVLYKKRTEQEVRQKFIEYDINILDDIIDFLKENQYIDDNMYIEKFVKEYMSLKDMSIKELQYKLLSKGISKDKTSNYICSNKEALLDYEINSAKNIYTKKQHIECKEDIFRLLRKKGYLEETIKIVGEDNE